MNITPTAAVKISETLAKNPRAGEIFGVMVLATGVGLVVLGGGTIFVCHKIP